MYLLIEQNDGSVNIHKKDSHERVGRLDDARLVAALRTALPDLITYRSRVPLPQLAQPMDIKLIASTPVGFGQRSLRSRISNDAVAVTRKRRTG